MATAAQPRHLKHDRPDSGLNGWAAAWDHLDRIDNDRQREALSTIVRGLGVQGAPALRYAAGFLRWTCGLTPDYRAPGKALKQEVAMLIERRCRQELDELDGDLFPFRKHG